MSIDVDARAEAVDPHTGQDLYGPVEIVQALRQARKVELTPAPDHLTHTWGSSRSGYADHALETLLSQAQLPALAFLTGERCMYRVEDRVHGVAQNFTILRTPAGLARVDTAFSELFQWCEAHPDAVADVSGLYDEDEILAILRKTGISSSPRYDLQIHGDDEGNNVDYLFAYLRSVHAVVKCAAAHQLAFLYVQDTFTAGGGMDEEQENEDE